MAKIIANKYATALFELSMERDNLENIYNEVKTIIDLVKQSDLTLVLNHPKLSSQEKFLLLKNVFEDKVSNDIMGLFSVVINKNRENEILEILEQFISLAEKQMGICKAEVCCASKLTDEQLSTIKNVLSKKLDKQVIIEVEIMPELIGGLRIIAEGKIIDSSVKYQLELLKANLDNIILA